MDSSNIELNHLKASYYTPSFINVPKNPFSIILFCYLGEINPSLYEDYLKIFKQIIVTGDTNRDTVSEDFFFENKPHDRFPLNKNIPENAYLFTLTNGEFQDSFSPDMDLLEEVIDIIQKEEPEIFSVYYFLGDFFKLSLKFYNSIKDFLKIEEESAAFSNINSTKEVYFVFDEKYKDDIYNPLPILEREIDGVIRLKSFKMT